MNLKDHIRSYIKIIKINDILFRICITTLIKNAEAFEETVNQIVERRIKIQHKFDKMSNLFVFLQQKYLIF